MTAAISADLQALIRGGNAEESLRRGMLLLGEAETRADPLELASLLATISLAHQYAGRPRESLLALYRAIDLLQPFEQNCEVAGTAAWLQSLAAADLAALGDAAEALAFLNRTQSYLSDANADPELSVRILNNIAVTQHRFGRNHDALESIRQAIEVSGQLGDGYFPLHSRANLVIYQFIVARELNETDPDRAAEDAAETLALAHRLETEAMTSGYPHVVAMMYREAGPVLVQTGNADLARRQLRRCLELAASAGRRRESSALMIRLATVERMLGEPGNALDLLASISDVDVEADPELGLEFHAERSETLAALAKFEDALASYRVFHRLQLRRIADLADAKAQGLAARLGAEQARLRASLYQSRNADLTEQTRHDPLTGVGNRRKLDEQLGELSHSPAECVAVLFADLDRFKAVNDVFGHHVGDQVLIQVASRLSAALSSQETICRYGGEEFVILLPGSGHVEALRRAEQFRRMIAEFDWESVHHGLHVTCSIGVDSGEASTINDVIFGADTALAAAKDHGRNQVRSAPASATPRAQWWPEEVSTG